MSATKILVTAVGAPPGLAACRSLAAEGHELVVVDVDPWAPGLFLPGVTARLVPRAGEEAAYVERLLAICREDGVGAIVPCVEDEVVAIARNRAAFAAAGVGVLVPEPEVLDAVVDKLRLVETGARSNVSVPRSWPLQGAGAEPPAPPPLVVKRRAGHGARDLHWVDDLPGWRRLLATIDDPAAFLVQERVTGGAGSVYAVGLLYDSAHRRRATFCSRSLATLFPRGGPATAGEPVDEPDLVAAATRLLDATGGWVGPAMIEFKREDGDGSFHLLDVNPRIWGYSQLATACGINFAHLTAELALGRELGAVPSSWPTDVLLVRTPTDRIIRREDLP